MNSTASSRDLWESIIGKTHELISQDDTFDSLKEKDKLLTFYYYHFDVVVDYRAFIVDQLLSIPKAVSLCFQMNKYEEIFHNIVDPMIERAIQEKSLKPIPLFDRSYFKFFWVQHLFILRYWATDESNEYENTIALIEKSIRSSFDFMSNGEVRSSVDLWKFVWQNPIKMKLKYD